MPFYGYLEVKERCGADGTIFSTFSLRNKEFLLGRAEGCDIQIRLLIVSKVHVKLKVQDTDGVVNIIALSKTNNTKRNGVLNLPYGQMFKNGFSVFKRPKYTPLLSSSSSLRPRPHPQ